MLRRIYLVFLFFSAFSAIVYGQELMENKSNTSARQIALSYYFSDFDSSIFYFNKYRLKAIKQGDKNGEMESLSRLSMLFKRKGRMDTAIALVYQAIEIGEQNHYDTLLAETYLRLGNYYLKLKQFDKAMVFYRKTINLDFPNTQHGAMGAIGQLFMKKGELDSAQFYSEKALNYFRQLDTNSTDVIYNSASLYGSLGIIAFQKNQYKKGIYYLEEALRLSRKINNVTNEISSLLNLSIAYDYLKKPSKALGAVQKAIFLSDSIGNNKYKLKAYKVMTEHFVENQQFEKAYFTTTRYHALQDSLDKVDYNKIIYENELKYNTRIQEEKQKRVLAEEKQKQTLLWITIIVSFLIFVMITLMLYRRIQRISNERKKLNEKADSMQSKLSEAKAQLSELNAHLAEQNKRFSLLLKEVDTGKANDDLKTVEDLEKIKILRNEDWKKYLEVFQLLFPEFFKIVLEQFPSLSEGDKRQLIMIKLDYSKAKSAEILGITEGAVKRGRQRLSKKLGLDDVTQLKGFVERV